MTNAANYFWSRDYGHIALKFRQQRALFAFFLPRKLVITVIQRARGGSVRGTWHVLTVKGTNTPLTCDAACLQVNVFLLFLKGSCKTKRSISYSDLTESVSSSSQICTQHTQNTKAEWVRGLSVVIKTPDKMQLQSEDTNTHYIMQTLLYLINPVEFSDEWWSTAPALFNRVTFRDHSIDYERNFSPCAGTITVCKASRSTAFRAE